MKSKLGRNQEEFEVIVAVTANLRAVGFKTNTNMTLLEKSLICVQISSNNNNPTKRINNARFTEQMKAFHQAIVDLQGAGLWVNATLSLNYNSALNITIMGDNSPRFGKNSGQCLAAINNGIPAPSVPY